MLGAAVVPKRNGARRPLVTHGKTRVLHPFGQVVQNHTAFRGIHFYNAASKVFVHVQGFGAGLRVHAHYRVHGHILRAVMRVRVMQCA